MAQQVTWQNRIVGVGEEPADQLLANPRNYRIHSMFQQDVVKGSLDELGWIKRVTVNRRTGFVVDGHLRVKLASRYGQIVPVEYVDLSDEEEGLALALIDPTAALAATDQALLNDLLTEIKTGEESVQALLEQMAREEPAPRAGMEVDHTAVFLRDEPGTVESLGFQERRTRLGMMDAYENTTVRQVVLIMNVEEYSALIPDLRDVRAAFGVEDQYGAVRALIDFWRSHHAE